MTSCDKAEKAVQKAAASAYPIKLQPQEQELEIPQNDVEIFMLDVGGISIQNVNKEEEAMFGPSQPNPIQNIMDLFYEFDIDTDEPAPVIDKKFRMFSQMLPVTKRATPDRVRNKNSSYTRKGFVPLANIVPKTASSFIRKKSEDLFPDHCALFQQNNESETQLSKMCAVADEVQNCVNLQIPHRKRDWEQTERTKSSSPAKKQFRFNPPPPPSAPPLLPFPPVPPQKCDVVTILTNSPSKSSSPVKKSTEERCIQEMKSIQNETVIQLGDNDEELFPDEAFKEPKLIISQNLARNKNSVTDRDDMKSIQTETVMQLEDSDEELFPVEEAINVPDLNIRQNLVRNKNSITDRYDMKSIQTETVMQLEDSDEELFPDEAFKEPNLNISQNLVRNNNTLTDRYTPDDKERSLNGSHESFTKMETNSNSNHNSIFHGFPDDEKVEVVALQPTQDLFKPEYLNYLQEDDDLFDGVRTAKLRKVEVANKCNNNFDLIRKPDNYDELNVNCSENNSSTNHSFIKPNALAIRSTSRPNLDGSDKLSSPYRKILINGIQKRSDSKFQNIDENWPNVRDNTIQVSTSTNFGGFSTGHGKKIEISEASMQKSSKIFQNLKENWPIVKNNSIQASTSTNFGGFSTGHGKKIEISEASMQKSSKIFQNLEENWPHIKETTNQPSTSKNCGGFSTGLGKKIEISEASMKKSSKIFQNLDENWPNFQNSTIQASTYKNFPDNKETTNQTSASTKFEGFSTGLGKKIEISEASMEKSSKIFKHLDENWPIVKENSIQGSTSTKFGGFSTGHGKKIKISEASMKKSSKIFQYLDENWPDSKKTTNQPSTSTNFEGFSTCHGKKIEFSEASMQKSSKIFQNLEENWPHIKETTNQPSTSKNCGGFSTGLGKKIEISEASMKKSLKIFQNLDENWPNFQDSTIQASTYKNFLDNKETKNQASTSTKFKGFSTGLGKIIEISEASMEKSSKIFKNLDENWPIVKENSIQGSTSTIFGGFSTSHGKKIKISEASLQKSSKIFENLEENWPHIKETTNQPSTSTKFEGFSTGHGKKIEISEASLQKSSKIFKYLDDNWPHIKENTNQPTTSTKFEGFSTGLGKKIEISEASMQKSSKIFQNLGKNVPNVKDNLIQASTSTNFGGFSTGLGKKIEFSEASLQKSSKIFQNLEENWPDIKETTNQPSTSTKFEGFSTGLGKKIEISEASMQKSSKIFQNLDKNWPNVQDNTIQASTSKNFPDNKETTNQASTSTYFGGFSTGLGKKIDISEASMQKSSKIFQNLNENWPDIKETTNQPSTSTKFEGFSTGLGKKIEISEASMEKSSKIFKHLDENWPIVKENSIQGSTSTKFGGFSTGHGKKIKISEASMKKSSKIFQNLDENWPDSKKTTNQPSTSTNFEGFSTCHGKKIEISEASMQKSSKIFQNLDENWPDSKKTTNQPSTSTNFEGFSTCHGKKIEISEASMQKSSKIFKNLEENWPHIKETTNQPSTSKKCGGFSTGLGKKIEISEASLQKSSKIFQNLEENWPNVNSIHASTSTNCPDNKEITNQASTSTKFEGCSTGHGFSASGSKINISDKTLRNISGLFDNMDEGRVATNSPNRNYNFPKIGKSATVTMKTIGHKQSKLEMFDEMLENLDKDKSLCDKENNKENFETPKNVGFKTPLMGRPSSTSTPLTHSKSSSCTSNGYLETPKQPISITQEITNSTKALLADEAEMSNEFNGFDLRAFGCDEYSESPQIPHRKNWRKPKKTRLLNFDEMDSEEEQPPPALDVTVRLARTMALASQMVQGKAKTNVKPCPGYLFLKKLTSEKQKLTEFLHNLPDRELSPLKPNVKHLTCDNYRNFKFNSFDHFPKNLCLENVDGIHMDDQISLIINENGEIGLSELKSAFLSCPSVDCCLLHPAWFENNFKWILLKLARLEIKFPEKLGNAVLTPQNVLLQLKYRYDREIDHAERSAIRKICEKDDVPSKRLVLVVNSVIEAECQLELSDGWFGLKTTLDVPLQNAVKNGKIKVGTKLMIQGAELVGLSEACSPLEIPDSVRLNIAANSTRRCRPDTKLGYYTNLRPFVINVNSILHNGGSIAELHICILRIYPMLYAYKTKGSTVTVFHSEKVENGLKQAYDKCDASNIEQIYSQVLREMEAEEALAKLSCRRPATLTRNIANISCASQLNDLLENGNDPDAIEAEMTTQQKQSVLAYRLRQNDLKMEQINRRVQQKLRDSEKSQSKRKVTPLLRMKLCDMRMTSTTDQTTTLTIWKPDEDIHSLLQENSQYRLLNVKACGMRFGELQLSSGKFTKLVKMGNNESSGANQLCRRICPLSEIKIGSFEPLLNEFDTIGLVVQIDAVLNRKFQSVYVVDSRHNLLSLQFWNGIKEFGYECVVKLKSFLYIRNIQWRKINSVDVIPCGFITEDTTFTESPKCETILREINAIQTSIVHIDEYIDECTAIIKQSKEHKPSNLIPSTSTSNEIGRRTNTPSTTNFNGPSTSSSAVTKRINHLSVFKHSPATSPLFLNRLKVKQTQYKVPSSNH